ncbi:ribosome biogenesis protein tsr1 [Coemansia asiatica]|uniref:Ribosome biogenesis protein tsr1 n=1 Tax=Coemansia asiatica TaxID=1052880 RepID=A0A9W7XNJ0_9FUNG|nr:ribosome biogenesis protein tsr1 [Coemansia asiatica]
MPKKEEAFHHRASLKQKHKPFKRRFATKNSMRDKAKGRTQRLSIKGKVQRKHSRADRRNAVRTEQRKKREQIVQNTRIFTGRHRAPKIVAVIPLCSDTDTTAIVRSLFSCVEEEFNEAVPKTQRVLNVGRFKQTVQFVEVGRNLLDILDVAAVADYMVFGISANVEVDAFGEQCLSAIQNQGHAAVFPVVQGLEDVAAKKRNDVRKSLQSFMQHFFPEIDKVFSVDTDAEALAILRMVTSQVPRGIKWRDSRSYLLAESVEFEPSAEDPQIGRMAVTGYVRGANLSANRLVHVPNFGDFQIECIFDVPVAVEAVHSNAIEEDDEPAVLDRPDPAHQDSLVAANEPDQMANEQTWPEDEEMAGWEAQMAQMEEDEKRAAASGERVVRVPRGMSSYQAAWIPDEDSEEGGSDVSSDEDDSMMGSDDSEDEDEDEDEEYEDMRLDAKGRLVDGASEAGTGAGTGASDAGNNDDGDEDMPTAEEEAMHLRAYLAEREKQSLDDAQFPDEVDTPMDVPARQRFARYRGLQSFRTSPWDPYENLPLDYARIFQFENLRRTQSRILRMAEGAPARVGSHVRVVLRAVPIATANSFHKDRPFVVYGLLQYEHQMSVMHFTVMRNEEYAAPVRSKDPLVVHMGFRRYNVQPLFSQHLRAGSNGVHKFERFLKHGVVSVATVFAPIQLGAVPVSLYLPTPADSSGRATLVGTGTTLDANPARILAKRIVLTGAPYKIHKRGAVIRFMFFNAEDVNWFKPVQLHTKYGRIGHITESLGTHGYMKCIFDGPIKQMDTVCMNLYKRVFPKWTTTLWSEHEQDEAQRLQWTAPADDEERKPEFMEL